MHYVKINCTFCGFAVTYHCAQNVCLLAIPKVNKTSFVLLHLPTQTEEVSCSVSIHNRLSSISTARSTELWFFCMIAVFHFTWDTLCDFRLIRINKIWLYSLLMWLLFWEGGSRRALPCNLSDIWLEFLGFISSGKGPAHVAGSVTHSGTNTAGSPLLLISQRLDDERYNCKQKTETRLFIS